MFGQLLGIFRGQAGHLHGRKGDAYVEWFPGAR